MVNPYRINSLQCLEFLPTLTIGHGISALDTPSRETSNRDTSSGDRFGRNTFGRDTFCGDTPRRDTSSTRHSKDRDAPEEKGEQLRGNGAAAVTAVARAVAGIKSTGGEGPTGLRQTKAAGMRKGASKKVVIAADPDRGTSKSRADKPSQEVVANGGNATGAKKVKAKGSKMTGTGTGSSKVGLSKTPAKKKLKSGKLPTAKQSSASPNVDTVKRGASTKTSRLPSTGAVGKRAGPKPSADPKPCASTQCNAVDESSRARGTVPKKSGKRCALNLKLSGGG